jgi:hypothetical protein
VPRAKYRQPPGPYPPIEHIRHSTFHFRKDQHGKLIKLLPSKMAKLSAPPLAPSNPLPAHVKSIADLLVWRTEGAINSHLTLSSLNSEHKANPANVRAAIRRLRTALKPFVRGWVDEKTAEIVPPDLDDRLAAREQEISKLRLSSARRRNLGLLCQTIEIAVRQWATANEVPVSEQEMLRYIDAALSFAKIDHPKIPKHRARLSALVFPDP